LLAGVALPESVADHSFVTALVAWILAEMVNAESAEEENTAILDVGRVVLMAICHDLAESSVTDLPREAVSYIGADAKHAAEAVALETLFGGIPGGAEIAALWDEYQAGESPEARLVHDADKLEMVVQARHYAAAGNANLDEFWRGHTWSYAATRTLFAQFASAQPPLK
jgi:putative hydrolase of HD superfamily